MESLVMFADAFRNKTVWVSGHTGFKGAWLSEWLIHLGAKVHGFSLPPPTRPSLFDKLKLKSQLRHQIGDVRDLAAVRKSIRTAKPDFAFHLAAQPLVRASYSEPVETYETNVMGTVHVLEALRELKKPCAAVFITTDKCYENREWHYAYREEDSLGGHDPYSSSKAAAEIAIQSFRRSFFKDHVVRIASARAGNVIGGGDWAVDRIVPDSIRALSAGKAILVRSPNAVRPWQHILECCSGYLWLAARLAQNKNDSLLAGAFNFGPDASSRQPVRVLIENVLQTWPGKWVDGSDPKAVHEAKLLTLSIEKAAALLDWRPCWNFEETVRFSVEWYQQHYMKKNPDMRSFTISQIDAYVESARQKNVAWANA